MRHFKKLRELWTGMFSKPIYGSCGGGDPAVWEENARKQTADASKDSETPRAPGDVAGRAGVDRRPDL